MKTNIPKATLSATQFRTYGAGGFHLDAQEAAKGCPRQYQAKYVLGTIPPEPPSYPLEYGSAFHRVLHLMEEGMTPDEALTEAFGNPTEGSPLGLDAWEEAREDLDRYMERGATPTDRFGTLASEVELKALLYEDEEYGPIYYRGFIDWLGIDLDMHNVLHVVDYKTNRTPPKEADLEGDVQMRGYHWLVMKNAHQWMNGNVRIVTHYDAVKFREVQTAYTDQQIEDWESWAIAVARRILRDREFPAVLNDGCAHCPIRRDCPAFATLPEVGRGIAEGASTFETAEGRLLWRDDANRVRLVLEKAVKSIDAEIRAEAEAAPDQTLVVGNQQFVVEPRYVSSVDLPRLHQVLGDTFYQVVSASKTAVERVTKPLGTEIYGAAQACVSQFPSGMEMKRRTVK